MRRPVIVSAVGAVLFLACGSQRSTSGPAPTSSASSASSSAPDRPSTPASASASSAPDASAAPAASSSPDAPACAEACAAGTTCALTKRGPACVECAPGSLPTCKEDRFVAVCGDDGTLQKTTDCSKKSKRCLSGTCQSRECTPNALHCFEGNVYKCNAAGSAGELMTTCMTDDGNGILTVDNGVCQVRRGVAACHDDCFEPDGTILALYGCGACEPPPGDFCATVGKHGCSDRICRKFPDSPKALIAGPAVVEGSCPRETDGLAVPGSDKRGGCEGTGERVVSYQVCRGGHAIAATRKEPCKK